jgi:hypothetical protein
MFKKGVTPGFDIEPYTGNGVAGRTVSHILGAKPAFIVVKSLDSTGGAADWVVYHSALGATQNIRLQSSAAAATQTVMWNDTEPTASVFSLGTNNNVNYNGTPMMAYVWSEVPGFSKFGSYTGNASANGPFVYTGFKPAFVLVKQNNTDNWRVIDNARDPYNPSSHVLLTSLAGTDTGSGDCTIDFVANGFKIRSAGNTGCNDNGVINYYAAFAEQPFVYATGR